ncbi:hypothetical protein [Streptomyces sp. NPDC058240]|uniref:LexA family protein n=1 Tax=Streptomyces sp. NPDC058240 TaxID=3346396 RepID=UPI0036EDC87D
MASVLVHPARHACCPGRAAAARSLPGAARDESGITLPDVLSARQEAILRTIPGRITETGESPSSRQIGDRVGLSGTSSVAYRLGRFEPAD